MDKEKIRRLVDNDFGELEEDMARIQSCCKASKDSLKIFSEINIAISDCKRKLKSSLNYNFRGADTA